MFDLFRRGGAAPSQAQDSYSVSMSFSMDVAPVTMSSAPDEARAMSIEDVARLIDQGGVGARSSAGEVVTRLKATMNTAVWACVGVIASHCATPPIRVMRGKAGGGKEEARDHPVWRVLCERPNEWQVSFEFREMMTMWAALDSRAIAWKNVVGGELRELIPIEPGTWQRETHRYGEFYTISDEFGPIGRFPASDFFIITNRNWSLVKDLPAVRTAREAIGLGIAIEGAQSALAKNGMRPSTIVTSDPIGGDTTSKEVRERIRGAFQQVTHGPNRGGTAYIDKDLKVQQLAMNGVDAQLLETRRFQVEEVCRAFGVFPIMVMQTDKAATYASASAMFQASHRFTAAPWQARWASRADEYLLDGGGALFVEFDNRAITQEPLKERGEAYQKLAFVYTRNELREMEGLPRIDDPEFDKPLTPLNMGMEVEEQAEAGGSDQTTEGEDNT